MDLYSSLGVARYINAHDTYTVYGGSRMAPETLRAMAEAAGSFVDIEELQRKLGEKIAELTHNEGAYLTNGAAGGLLLTAAVCMAKGDIQRYSRLPELQGGANELIIMRCQRNPYDAALTASGGTLIEIGGADSTTEQELKRAINPHTAAVYYFAASFLARGALPLPDVIRIAHAAGVPVIVDAAAQLPPVENLWSYTQQGADLVLFSGGKTLCGPQDSGLILGRRELIQDCIRFGAPVHGICRACKTSREAMVGLFTALKRYLALDHQQNTRRLLAIDEELVCVMRKGGLRAEIVNCGPVGQTYPRAFGYCEQPGQAEAIVQEMRRRRIYIGLEGSQAIYISPLNLEPDEVQQVATALKECLSQWRTGAPEGGDTDEAGIGV